ncbi:hypothetical protein Tco_0014835, partial [Tanacetum coccineum]
TVSNDSEGTSEENSQDCIVMPIWKDTSYFDSPNKDVDNGEPKTVDNAQKQVKDGPNNENAEQESLKLNVVGPSVNTASPNEQDSIKEEPKVNLGNITNSYIVPTTPNTRIHKDYLIDNVIGEVKSIIEPTSIAKALLIHLRWKQYRKNFCNSNFNRSDVVYTRLVLLDSVNAARAQVHINAASIYLVLPSIYLMLSRMVNAANVLCAA